MAHIHKHRVSAAKSFKLLPGDKKEHSLLKGERGFIKPTVPTAFSASGRLITGCERDNEVVKEEGTV